MEKTVIKYINGRKFKISSSFIPQTKNESKEVFFLDEIFFDDLIKRDVILNVCNGDYDYCLKTMNSICHSA